MSVDAFNIGFLFLSMGSAVFSYLWWKSRYIPRLLSGWGILASSVMALMSLAIIVSPGLTAMGMTYMMPMGLYEFGLGFWLLVKGIQAPSAAEPSASRRRAIHVPVEICRFHIECEHVRQNGVHSPALSLVAEAVRSVRVRSGALRKLVSSRICFEIGFVHCFIQFRYLAHIAQ